MPGGAEGLFRGRHLVCGEYSVSGGTLLIAGNAEMEVLGSEAC